jgi:hypothetical protein
MLVFVNEIKKKSEKAEEEKNCVTLLLAFSFLNNTENEKHSRMYKANSSKKYISK